MGHSTHLKDFFGSLDSAVSTTSPFRIEKDGVLVDSPCLWKFSAIVKGGRRFLAMRTTRKKRASFRTISFAGALLLSAVILRNRPNQTNLACLLISIFMVVQF